MLSEACLNSIRSPVNEIIDLYIMTFGMIDHNPKTITKTESQPIQAHCRNPVSTEIDLVSPLENVQESMLLTSVLIEYTPV